MRSSVFIFCLLFQFCNNPPVSVKSQEPGPAETKSEKKLPVNKYKTIHVFVALCDNKYQGIVTVGKSIGNGQDAVNNLYWGCDYGILTHFKRKSSEWILVERTKYPKDTILERALFKHKEENVFLLAEAYDGRYIKQTTMDFLASASGKNPMLYKYKTDSLIFGGGSDLVSYIGHDGLMDFTLPVQSKSNVTSGKAAIILSCYSKYYFSPHLKNTNADPLIWTTHLMAPEAYTLHDALGAWIKNKSRTEIQLAAAAAYAKYQKCSLKAAKNLLVSGW